MTAQGITLDIPLLTERIEAAVGHWRHRHSVAVIVPLREHVREVAAEFLAEGPPFDPGQLGLGRHQVFLGDREVVFVFESPDARPALERILSEPDFWSVLHPWEHLLADQPRVAPILYDWPEPEHRHRPRDDG